MNNWKGNWIITVAILHSIYAIVRFGSEYQSIAAAGIIGSLSSAQESLAAWFFLFGILMLACGLLVRACEARSIPVAKSVAVTLLVLSGLGVALMPVSGFWLMLPPALAMMISKDQT